MVKPQSSKKVSALVSKEINCVSWSNHNVPRPKGRVQYLISVVRSFLGIFRFFFGTFVALGDTRAPADTQRCQLWQIWKKTEKFQASLHWVWADFTSFWPEERISACCGLLLSPIFDEMLLKTSDGSKEVTCAYPEVFYRNIWLNSTVISYIFRVSSQKDGLFIIYTRKWVTRNIHQL